MAWFVWACVLVSVLLVIVAAIVLLAAALRLMRHLTAVSEAATLRDAAKIAGQLQRLEVAGEGLSALAARATAARALLAESITRLTSPLFYFGRLP